jgi:RNA polymerase sigma-70 factor (ECF subfamily)
MEAPELETVPEKDQWSDEEIVGRVRAGETALFEIIMRRYNQRLYRLARAILRDDSEAEDVMQDAYVRAYEHLGQFAGRARFSTWLTRIAIHEALARARRRKRLEPLETPDAATGESSMNLSTSSLNPEEQTSLSELGKALEGAILAIPEQYRVVLMMRDVEQMDTAETAAALDLTTENVKVRLHRARALVRKQLYAKAVPSVPATFGFMGVRCDRVVHRVLQLLATRRQSPHRTVH